MQEETLLKQQRKLEEEKQELQRKKEEYQRDLERLRDAQRKLERDREALQRQFDKMEEIRATEVSGDNLRILIIMVTICCPSVTPSVVGWCLHWLNDT